MLDRLRRGMWLWLGVQGIALFYANPEAPTAVLWLVLGIVSLVSLELFR